MINPEYINGHTLEKYTALTPTNLHTTHMDHIDSSSAIHTLYQGEWMYFVKGGK